MLGNHAVGKLFVEEHSAVQHAEVQHIVLRHVAVNSNVVQHT